MKVAILGAGALGSVFGGYMVQAGIDACLLDINEAHIEAINKSGLRFDTPEGTSQVEIPAMQPAECPLDVGLVILLTKAFHTKSALQSINALIAAKVPVLSLQNGLGNKERMAELLPEDQIFYGSTLTPGGFVAPGHVETQGKSWTKFRPLTEQGVETAQKISDLLSPVGFEYSTDADIYIWQKAAFNCAMNTTCTLINHPVGAVTDSDQAIVLVKRIADEVIDVAIAKGISADKSSVHAHLDEALELHRQHKPSMLQDMEAGRQTEIESLCGEVARQANNLGVAAPLNEALATLVRLKQA